MSLRRTSVFASLVTVFLWAEFVLAGHFMFEPKVGYAASSIFSKQETLHTEFASNDSVRQLSPLKQEPNTQLDKRSVVISLQPNSNRGIWYKKTILYTYSDEESRAALQEDLKAAMEVWYSAGLPRSFRMRDKDTEDDPVTWLIITYDKPTAEGGSGTLVTSVGVPSRKEQPVMVISDDSTKGTMDKIANYAHELGHAWGLFHEHQNPNFWSTDFTNGKGGAVFTTSDWNCENLEDYETALTNVNNKIATATGKYLDDLIGFRGSMCTDRISAAQLQFSAREYLPLTSSEMFVPDNDSPDGIDWDSIMLYPSGAGGLIDSNGERMLVLTKDDGSEIVANLRPSQRDVQALIKLYKDGDEENSDDDDDDDYSEMLLNDPESPNSATFSDVRNADIGTTTC